MYKMLIDMVMSRYKDIRQKGFIDKLAAGGQWSSFKDYPHFQI